MNQGKRSGFGIEYHPTNQEYYQGLFEKGVYQGWGKTNDYEGEFKQGKYNGWGKWKGDRYIYEGYFKEGLFDGIGALNVTKKEVESYCVQNWFLGDEEVQIKYVGEWRGGKIVKGKLVTKK